MTEADHNTDTADVSRRRLLVGSIAVAGAVQLSPASLASTDSIRSMFREWRRLELVLLDSGAERDAVEARHWAGRMPAAALDLVDGKIDELLDRQARLLDRICDAPVSSLADVAAKLSVVVARGQSSASDPDFPWPALRVLLSDLRLHVGGAIKLSG